jgi:hypothetical protein
LTDDFSFASLVNDTANATLPDRSDSGIFFDWITFNLRDQIREKENDPLQFKYIPADCRLYYKLSNVYNMPNLWHDVANANWNDQSLCLPGSTGVADNSIEPPPPTNITVIPPLVNWAVNDTDLTAVISDDGGIQDTSSRVNVITPCDSGCSGHCQDISIRCSKPGSPQTSVSACLPSCILRTGPNSCQSRAFCDPSGVVQLQSKANGLEKKGIVSTGHKQEVHGICRPQSTFIQSPGLFGCPN